MARDLLEDGEGAAERLYADALAILGVVVDIGLRRLDQPGDGWFLNRLSFVRDLTRLSPHSLIVEQHHALFGHVADRITRALAADTAVLDAAIGELIGAPGRAAVNDDAAGAQAANRAGWQARSNW